MARRAGAVGTIALLLAFAAIAAPVAAAAAAADPSPKDFWDKLSASSALVSGVLVALLGFLATRYFNRRQAREQQAQDEREARRQAIESERDLQLRRIDTVRGFFEHLSADDPRQKRAALLMVETLDSDLALRLANAFRDEASVSALSQIATTADAPVAEAARAGVATALDALRASVVQVGSAGGAGVKATGFCVRADGVIATTDYALPPHATEMQVELPDGTRLSADVLGAPTDGVALLKVARSDVPALVLAEGAPPLEALQDVVVLGATAEGMRVGIGSVMGVAAVVAGLDVPGPLLFASLDIEHGQGGAPVVDATGRVAGLVYGSTGSADRRMAILLPVDPLVRALARLGGEPAAPEVAEKA